MDQGLEMCSVSTTRSPVTKSKNGVLKNQGIEDRDAHNLSPSSLPKRGTFAYYARMADVIPSQSPYTTPGSLPTKISF